MQMRPKHRRIVCRCPDETRGVKPLRQSLKRRSRAEFQCGIPEVMSLVVMDAKSCVKLCKYSRKTVKLLRETWFVDEMSLRNRFTLSISQVLRVFLIVSDFCTPFPNLVNHRSAYLWPTSFERWGDVVWKSWLFPRACNPAFEARCWVLMKQFQRSCVKLKLCTELTARAAYKKQRPRHPASVESYLALDRFE